MVYEAGEEHYWLEMYGSDLPSSSYTQVVHVKKLHKVRRSWLWLKCSLSLSLSLAHSQTRHGTASLSDLSIDPKPGIRRSVYSCDTACVDGCVKYFSK